MTTKYQEGFFDGMIIGGLIAGFVALFILSFWEEITMYIASLLTEVIEDVAREIYYALTYMSPDNPGRANLEHALRRLGVANPEDVGLSNSLVHKQNWKW